MTMCAWNQVRVQTMALELQSLTAVGLAIGSRLRVSWSIKVNQQESLLNSSKHGALETWTDIWW